MYSFNENNATSDKKNYTNKTLKNQHIIKNNFILYYKQDINSFFLLVF